MEKTGRIRRKDITGQHFGEFVVIEFSYADKDRAYWKCLCSCGAERVISTGALTTGQRRSCGCKREELRRELTENLEGQKFARLLVLRRIPGRTGVAVYYQCICDCGTETIVRADCLKSGHTKSCGCLQQDMRVIKVGDKYGRLTVVSEARKDRYGSVAYWCRCECGQEKRVLSRSLRSGGTVSCGCYARERSSKFAKKQFGPNHPCWKSELTEEDRIRRRLSWKDHKNWRRRVLNRDKSSCQICGSKDMPKMVAHHIDGYDWCVEGRFDDSNGITLCWDCHIDFHSKFGSGSNTRAQFEEYCTSRSLSVYTAAGASADNDQDFNSWGCFNRPNS